MHVDANRLVEAIDQLTVQDLPATAVPAIESIDAAWRDMSGIRELLQTRYDILAATASGDTDLARALRRLSIPAIGNGLLCTGVDAQRRELARGGDYAERGAPSGSEARGSDGRESGVRETWTGNDPDCEFVYMLRHYDLVKERRSYSPWYVCNQFRWRLLMFPRRDHGLDEYMSVYLQCGGPVTEETEKIAETESEKGNTSWHCSVKFGLHLLHSSSPLAIACKEMKEEDACYRAIDLRSRSMASGPARGECADIVEEFYHVFRETSDDWGYELAPFSILQPGKYADHDMNLVFMVRIQVEGK